MVFERSILGTILECDKDYHDRDKHTSQEMRPYIDAFVMNRKQTLQDRIGIRKSDSISTMNKLIVYEMVRGFAHMANELSDLFCGLRHGELELSSTFLELAECSLHGGDI